MLSRKAMYRRQCPPTSSACRAMGSHGEGTTVALRFLPKANEEGGSGSWSTPSAGVDATQVVKSANTVHTLKLRSILSLRSLFHLTTNTTTLDTATGGHSTSPPSAPCTSSDSAHKCSHTRRARFSSVIHVCLVPSRRDLKPLLDTLFWGPVMYSTFKKEAEVSGICPFSNPHPNPNPNPNPMPQPLP